MSASAGPAQFRRKPTTTGGGAAFTDEMRDRQARGKDPYERPEGMEDDDDDDDENDDGAVGGRRRRLRLGHGPQADSFEDRERRGYAMSVLDSPEQLMMHAQSTGDSIPGQRLRFMSMLCGFNPPPPPPPPASAHQSPQQHPHDGKKSSSSRRDGSGAKGGERANR